MSTRIRTAALQLWLRPTHKRALKQLALSRSQSLAELARACLLREIGADESMPAPPRKRRKRAA